jgi:uncharacterized RDD family membrane protein YckC
MLLFTFWIVAYFIFSLVVADVLALVEGMSGLTKTIAILGWFATQWLFWTVSEVFWNGQTPGKRLLRIRVVREDGGPIGFFESAVRNLCRVVDFAPVAYAAGLLTMLVTRQNRRLGDLLAGTLLVREEKFDLDKYRQAGPIDALPVGKPLGLSPLASAELELVLGFLARREAFTPDARRKLGLKLVQRFAAGLPEADRAAAAVTLAATEDFLQRRVQP